MSMAIFNSFFYVHQAGPGQWSPRWQPPGGFYCPMTSRMRRWEDLRENLQQHIRILADEATGEGKSLGKWYANIWLGVYWWQMLPYIVYMDPMGSWLVVSNMGFKHSQPDIWDVWNHQPDIWEMLCSILYMGCHPSQLTHIYQRGRSTTNQIWNDDP